MRTTFSCNRTCPFFERVDICRFTALLRSLGVRQVVNSHIVSVDVEIRDFDALVAACDRLGLDVKAASTYRWYGVSMGDDPLPAGVASKAELGNCNFAASVRGNASAYELGIVADGNGGYRLLFDFWGNNGKALQLCIGENAAELVKEYGFAAADIAAKRLGWITERAADSLKVYHPLGGYLTVDGAANVEAFAFNGNGCHAAVSELAIAMGKPGGAIVKPEFYNVEQRVSQRNE